MQAAERLLQKARMLRIRVARIIRGTKWGLHDNIRMTRAGIEFDSLREYQPGDDIRSIDWKSSARSRKLIVRSYNESRNRTIFIVVDFTASMRMGSRGCLKEEVARDIAVMMAYAAEITGDALGIAIIRDGAAFSIPPRSGKEHIRLIIARLMETSSSGSAGNWADMKQYIDPYIRRNALMVVLSDCIDEHFTQWLCDYARRHVVLFGRILDPVEYTIPTQVGLVMRDPESGSLLDLSTSSCRKRAQEYVTALIKKQDQKTAQVRVNIIALTTDTSYEDAFITLLRNGIV